MTLTDRIKKLEDRRQGPASIHVHYEDQDARETCNACRSMTPEQYADFQRNPAPGRPIARLGLVLTGPIVAGFCAHAQSGTSTNR